MNAPSYDIRDMLVYEDSGASSTLLIAVDNLFIGKEPSEPMNCVTIFDTPGFPANLTLTGQQGYERPSVQIRVRNQDYVNGWAQIQSIKDLLHGRANETWNGTLYTMVVCSSGPFFFDWDLKGRARFVVNFNIQRR